MNLTKEDLEAIGAMIDVAFKRNIVQTTIELSDTEETKAGFKLHPSGFMQTEGSLKNAPLDYFVANLQIAKAFPLKLTDRQTAVVYWNTGCNADGSLEGSTVNMGQFVRVKLSNGNSIQVSSFVNEVEAIARDPYWKRTKQTLAATYGLPPANRNTRYHAIRAESFEDIECWYRDIADTRER